MQRTPRIGLSVIGDAQRLQQVVTNLLGNAIKFTPAGGVVRVNCMRRGADLELTLSDTGNGISPAVLPHLFDEFWMGSQHHGRGGGLGLGLPIARSIVELHAGTLRAE
jgi:two-component system CheB/CheR fusion protein